MADTTPEGYTLDIAWLMGILQGIDADRNSGPLTREDIATIFEHFKDTRQATPANIKYATEDYMKNCAGEDTEK